MIEKILKNVKWHQLKKVIPDDQIVIDQMITKTINELVDAVNEIMTWRFETDEDSDWYDDPKCREQPSDPYAEQCKWIGKLCWYKLCEGDTWKVGRLEKIQENADAGYPFVFNGLGYKICESLVL